MGEYRSFSSKGSFRQKDEESPLMHLTMCASQGGVP